VESHISRKTSEIWATRSSLGNERQTPAALVADEVNRRSLGYARDDKGEGGAHLSRRYQGVDRAALSKITSSKESWAK
jgi:hypothetical protein